MAVQDQSRGVRTFTLLLRYQGAIGARFNLTPGTMAVLSSLYSRRNNKGEAFPSITTLQGNCRLARSTVTHGLSQLVAAKWKGGSLVERNQASGCRTVRRFPGLDLFLSELAAVGDDRAREAWIDAAEDAESAPGWPSASPVDRTSLVHRYTCGPDGTSPVVRTNRSGGPDTEGTKKEQGKEHPHTPSRGDACVPSREEVESKGNGKAAGKPKRWKTKAKRKPDPLPDDHPAVSIRNYWLANHFVYGGKPDKEQERTSLAPGFDQALVKLHRKGHTWSEIEETARLILGDRRQGFNWHQACQSPAKLLKKNPDGIPYYDAIRADLLHAQDEPGLSPFDPRSFD